MSTNGDIHRSLCTITEYIRFQRAAGVNRLAYFMGRDIVDIAKSVVFALCFSCVFVLVAAPLGTFAAYFGLSMCVC